MQLIYKTSIKFYIFVTIVLGAMSAFTIVDVLFKKREAVEGVLILLGSTWLFIFFLLSRFKLEISEKFISYRKFFFTKELKIQDIASFCRGDKRPVLKRNLSFEIKMKPGIKPSVHQINFNALSAEGREKLLQHLVSNGIEEEI